MEEGKYVSVTGTVQSFKDVRIWKHDPNVSHRETIQRHAVVEYSYDGQTYTTTMPYSSNDKHLVGDEVVINVLASDPSYVRETELLRNDAFWDIALLSITVILFYFLIKRFVKLGKLS